MIGTAGAQCAPIPKCTRSLANSETPTPNGMPHSSASRLDFTKLSNSRSRRSRTAQTAGYSVDARIWSTLFV